MLNKFKTTVRNFKSELKFYRLLLNDDRTPKSAKLLLGIAVGYALSPFDIIPDFVPLIGHLDDLIIVPALIILSLRRIPQEIKDDCRLMINP